MNEELKNGILNIIWVNNELRIYIKSIIFYRYDLKIIRVINNYFNEILKIYF